MAFKKKLFYVVSLVQKSLAFEWTAIGLKNHYDLTFVLLNAGSSPLESFLNENGIKTIGITYAGKKDFPVAFIKLSGLLIRHRPDIIHTHLFDGTLIGLGAAWLTRIKRRIYTRHNSTYHHLYFPDSVKYDRWSNALATEIISISQATDETLIKMEDVSPSKVVKIPHGFDLEYFNQVPEVRIENIRKKWGIKNDQLVIGVIARHIEWKGIQYIIPAFKQFLQLNSNAILVLANASGPYHHKIMELIKDIPGEHVISIDFEEDIAALYQVFNIYVHVPIDSTCEAFGQTYVEALASGIPSVFTLSGIGAEFIKNRENALVVPFKDSLNLFEALEELNKKKDLCDQLTENGKRNVERYFKKESMINALMELYDR